MELGAGRAEPSTLRDLRASFRVGETDRDGAREGERERAGASLDLGEGESRPQCSEKGLPLGSESTF